MEKRSLVPGVACHSPGYESPRNGIPRGSPDPGFSTHALPKGRAGGFEAAACEAVNEAAPNHCRRLPCRSPDRSQASAPGRGLRAWSWSPTGNRHPRRAVFNAFRPRSLTSAHFPLKSNDRESCLPVGRRPGVSKRPSELQSVGPQPRSWLTQGGVC